MSIISLKDRENAIVEASITLNLTDQIHHIEKYKSLSKGEFQLFETIQEQSFNFTKNVDKIDFEVKDDNIIGFRLIKTNEGNKDFIFQGINDKPRGPFFSFHKFTYKRWVNFIEEFKSNTELLKSIKKELYISSIALHFKDEFYWNDENSEILLDKVMVAEDYLPKNFIGVKNGEFVTVIEKSSKEGLSIMDRLEIKVNSKLTKIISISHNQIIQLKESVEVYSELEKLLSILLELHNYNKDILKCILLPDIKEQIKLNN